MDRVPLSFPAPRGYVCACARDGHTTSWCDWNRLAAGDRKRDSVQPVMSGKSGWCLSTEDPEDEKPADL
jgi:hypothetical protein